MAQIEIIYLPKFSNEKDTWQKRAILTHQQWLEAYM